MDNELHQRIESLEEICRQILTSVNGLRVDIEEFRSEQREENKKTYALLRQFGLRVGSVEDRVGSIEHRLQAVEETVFSYS